MPKPRLAHMLRLIGADFRKNAPHGRRHSRALSLKLTMWAKLEEVPKRLSFLTRLAPDVVSPQPMCPHSEDDAGSHDKIARGMFRDDDLDQQPESAASRQSKRND